LKRALHEKMRRQKRWVFDETAKSIRPSHYTKAFTQSRFRMCPLKFQHLAIQRVVLFFILLTLFTQIGYSTGQVVVEFLYWDPTTDPRYCYTCPSWIELYDDFLSKNQTMTKISGEYEEVNFTWIDFTSAEGISLKQSMNITSPNSLIIDSKLTIEGSFNETRIAEAIDAALNDTLVPSQSPQSLIPLLASAFMFGFFETFSPCLIALLSFTISFTLGETSQFKESLLRILTFGVGFMIAAILLGLTVGLLFLSLQTFQMALMWIVCAFAIFFGLNLLGFKKTSITTKPIVKRLTRRLAFTFAGLMLLGFIFYFLDPCIAPVFVAMLPILLPQNLLIIIAFFCIGLMVPFFFMGLLAGSISKLARATYKNRSRIRAASGVILIAYAVYIILFYLL
jgi:cytochrome c biogenesis protein CcdA